MKCPTPPPGTPPPPIWMMLDESFPGGSCIAHSNLLKHTAQILGVQLSPTNGTLEKVWASTDSDFSSEETTIFAGRPFILTVVQGTRENPGVNFFEGCFKFNNKWYPGAVGSVAYPSALALYRVWAAWPSRIVYRTSDALPTLYMDRYFQLYASAFDIPQGSCFPLP